MNTASVVVGGREPVRPSTPNAGGMHSRVLNQQSVRPGSLGVERATDRSAPEERNQDIVEEVTQTLPKQPCSPVPIKSSLQLRSAMRSSTVDGMDTLEDRVGESIIQGRLLFPAGELIAQKISQSVGIKSHTFTHIVDVGSGKYPGLGASLFYALNKISEINLKEDISVICHTWDDQEVSSSFREAHSKILIVTPARTPEISVKMDKFIDLIKKGASSNVDSVVKICSLVNMNETRATTEKYIDGLVTID